MRRLGLKKIFTTVVVCGIAACAIGSQAAQYTFRPYSPGGSENRSSAQYKNYDLRDLDHNKAYLWSFSWKPGAANEQITSATLTFNNINNWDNKSNYLAVYLYKDMPTLGSGWTKIGTSTEYGCSQKVYEYGDAQGIGKPFGTIGAYGTDKKIAGVYTDADSSYRTITFDLGNVQYVKSGNPSWNWNIYGNSPYYPVSDTNLVDDLNNWSSNSDWAFAFDPDCHYWNDGISLTINTAVPTPPAVPEPMSMVLGSMGFALMGAVRRLRRK